MLRFIVGGPDCGRIGDNLAMLPFMLTLMKEEPQPAEVQGLNPAVVDLIRPSAPFFFIEVGACSETPVNEYLLNVQDMHWRYHAQLHMAQTYFQHYGLPVPELPITLDLPSVTTGRQSRTAVIAPYSWSDFQGNKLWAHENWIAVIERLWASGTVEDVYVVGSSTVDDPEPYTAVGVMPFFNRSLAAVLGLIRSAVLFLSVDNGISHLAHYGGVDHHVLLYPGCLWPNWVCNPRSVMVRQGRPAQVTVDDVVTAAYQAMERAPSL